MYFRPVLLVQAVGGPWLLFTVFCSSNTGSLQRILECLTQLVNNAPDRKEKMPLGVPRGDRRQLPLHPDGQRALAQKGI